MSLFSGKGFIYYLVKGIHFEKITINLRLVTLTLTFYI